MRYINLFYTLLLLYCMLRYFCTVLEYTNTALSLLYCDINFYLFIILVAIHCTEFH